MPQIKRASAIRFGEEVAKLVKKLCGPQAAIKRERIEIARLEGASVAEAAREEADRILFPDKKVNSL